MGGPYVQSTLRESTGCRMRTSKGDLLPVTTGEDKTGKHRLIAGDSRVNEHGVLASMHTVWLREHNRVCDAMDGDSSMSDDEKFEVARSVRCRPTWPWCRCLSSVAERPIAHPGGAHTGGHWQDPANHGE